MIKIDLIISISFFISITFIVVFTIWLKYNSKDKNDYFAIYNHHSILYQCTYCTYVFNEFKNNSIIQCPKCKSYIERKVNVKIPKKQ